MTGGYALALLVSIAGVMACDLRWKLALRVHTRRTLALVGIGTVFLLAWDAVGISTGVFIRGEGPWSLGWDLAPQMPVEEPIFLLFLSYLTVVLWQAAQRIRPRREEAPS